MNTVETNKTKRIAYFAYGAAVYVLFLATLLYMIGFVGNWIVPKSIDSGTPASLTTAILINGGILALFAIQHAIMARPKFKAWWTQIIPQQIERSTFVLATCSILILLVWQWRPLPEFVWHVESVAGRALLNSLCVIGWLTVVYSSFCIDHFDLFGLRQVVLALRGKEYTDPGFAMPWIYKLVRNPLMLGFLLAFWSTPDMTQGHLLFAVLTTGYILIGVQLEERDLADKLGDDYRNYRAKTPMLLPIPRKSSKPMSTVTSC